MIGVLLQLCIPAGCTHRHPFLQQRHTLPADTSVETLIKLANAEFGACSRSMSPLNVLLPVITCDKMVAEQCPVCTRMVILLGTS